ncbi:MAG: type II secretion system F family protein [Chloroflexi bacterium]|nr:type II secretion system F family protein [Chloroflexota bacterium]
MVPTLLVGLVFFSTALLVLALVPVERVDVRKRVSPYGEPPTDRRPMPADPFTARFVAPFFGRVGRILGRLAPASFRADAEQRLETAGNPISVELYLALRVAGAVGAAALAVPTILNAQAANPTPLLGVLLLFWIAWRLPASWLNLRISARQGRIQRALPDALDLIVVCMEAGLAFDAAIAKVVEKTRGPLRDELARMLREMSLGKLRREALRDLGKRTAVPDLVTFVAALVQADQMGLSVAHVLRTQADEMRIKRRQRAEETAMKAPVKMLFPLILCIFPAMMVVTLGPALMAIYTNIIVRLKDL